MKFKGDILITDPCYIVKDEAAWDLCQYGEEMQKVGMKTFLTAFTEDEDTQVVFNTNTNEKLGEFCSDSTAISVVLLDEALAHNPDFKKDIKERPYIACIIKKFDGDIEIVESQGEDNEKIFTFVGKGNINFHTAVVDEEE